MRANLGIIVYGRISHFTCKHKPCVTASRCYDIPQTTPYIYSSAYTVTKFTFGGTASLREPEFAATVAVYPPVIHLSIFDVIACEWL